MVGHPRPPPRHPHPHPRPRPGHALPAPARRQRHAHRLHPRQRPLAGRAGWGRCDPAHQLGRRRDRRRLQRGRALDRVFRPVRGQHGRLPHAGRGRTAHAAHLASGRGCRAGVDARRRHPFPVGARRSPHAALEVLHGLARGRAARGPRPAPGLSGRHVRRRRAHRVPGDRLLGPGVAQLPRGPGAADRHRVDLDLGAHHAAVGGRAPHGSGVDGRGRLLHVRARLGEQRLVVRPGHGHRAAAHASRRLRREVPRRGRRCGGLRAGRLPARTRPGDGRLTPACDRRDR